MIQPNTILSLSADDARKFFLRKEIFCSIDFTKYFEFQKLIDDLLMKMGTNTIWNSSWLKDDIQKVIKETPIIDKKVLNEMDWVIQPDEVELFNNKYM